MSTCPLARSWGSRDHRVQHWKAEAGRSGDVWFVGDDWARDHHDIEVMDEHGRVLARARVSDGVAGLDRVHAVIASLVPAEMDDPGQVLVGIETDQGPWVQALVASGYRVFAVNPRLASRHREIVALAGAKDDKTDAHALADMVRTRHHQLRERVVDSQAVTAVRVVARAHQTMVWERTRHLTRLQAALRAYFPAAIAAFDEIGLASRDALELLTLAPTPAAAAALTPGRVATVLRRAHRRNVPDKAARIVAALRVPQLPVADVVAGAYAATVVSHAAVLATVVEQVKKLETQVEAYFGQHPDAEMYLSQPGLGPILAARVLGEFGDATDTYTSAKARKNYAGTAPVTKQSGNTKTVHARYIRNDRLVDALQQQAGHAIMYDPDSLAYYRQLRARKVDHNAALRQLANRLVGILHGCLKTGTPYDADTAWAHRRDAVA